MESYGNEVLKSPDTMKNMILTSQAMIWCEENIWDDEKHLLDVICLLYMVQLKKMTQDNKRKWLK